MYYNSRILAFIPARGGSKGIPGKNIIPLIGKPLIAYTIEAAKASNYIDDVIVSTDSTEIAEIAKTYGADVPCMRPAQLAEDTSATIDAILYKINFLCNKGRYYDILVLLQPTQPLRTVWHIDKAIQCYFEQGERPLVSVSPVSDHPILIRSIGINGELTPLLNCNSTVRRQDMPSFYRVNGCIYINKIDYLTTKTSFNDNPVPFIMDKQYSVDIDEPEDLALAEFYLKKREVTRV